MKWPYPDVKGKFGPYGGRFVPDTLMAACAELEKAYDKARKDKSFWKEFQHYNDTFAGRPMRFVHRSARNSGVGRPAKVSL